MPNEIIINKEVILKRIEKLKLLEKSLKEHLEECCQNNNFKGDYNAIGEYFKDGYFFSVGKLVKIQDEIQFLESLLEIK